MRGGLTLGKVKWQQNKKWAYRGCSLGKPGKLVAPCEEATRISVYTLVRRHSQGASEPKPWLISTSHIERQNLTMRMQLRRFTRLTNAFSKKLENLKAALSLHFAWYNFCRVHSTLRVTPAMAAGVSGQIWPLEQLLY
jgi:hypothetical protein